MEFTWIIFLWEINDMLTCNLDHTREDKYAAILLSFHFDLDKFKETIWPTVESWIPLNSTVPFLLYSS